MRINHYIIQPFLIALQFLTVIPIHLSDLPDKKQNALSILFYPVIGLIIGGILYGLAQCLDFLPLILSSSLLCVIWIILTGGLHLDGLADTADAWVGGFGNKERTLKIMKDPVCGAMGVISIVCSCLLKWTAIYSTFLLQCSEFLFWIPMFARLSPSLLFLTTPYVRQNGLGSDMAALLPKNICIGIIIFSWILALLSLSIITTLLMVVSFFIIIRYLRRQFIRRIGGITGDTLGATIEILENSLLIIALCWSAYAPTANAGLLF